MSTSMRSRHGRSTTLTGAPVTPLRSTHFRQSASRSHSPTVLPGGHSKLNVVTRVAIEGKAKQAQDGVSVKMYLKIALPLDSVIPGATIPLFPEENVKILRSQIHPLDQNSTPYNFSSSACPLLHQAARALSLPSRSAVSFQAAHKSNGCDFSSPVVSSSRSPKVESKTSPTESIAPVDGQYTGHILVSGYYISYVLPRIFPSQVGTDDLGSDRESEGYTPSALRTRPTTLGEKRTAQFMAAIDIWVPFILRPPRAPHLLSIPTPRCLHNHIKLRIFPPTATSSSFASLSSVEEDANTWDLTSDPHVTRSSSARPRRRPSFAQFADDETSDSSTTGFSDGCGIQGTFPSTERIRIRWAKPMKVLDVGGSGGGRRRVGVKDVKGEMVCIVKGKGKDPERDNAEGLIVDVEYKGTCKGVWFPGVATMLGMDIGLEAKGSDVSWVDGSPDKWTVSGGPGFTGFDVGSSPTSNGASSRASSFDSDSPPTSAPQDTPTPRDPRHDEHRAKPSSSLLQAPLPQQNVPDYSFETSVTDSTASSSLIGTVSSMCSSNSIHPVQQTQSPGFPITLHLNMNELLPPAKNLFTFTISGTIMVTPRATVPRAKERSNNYTSSPLSGNANVGIDRDPEPISLPRFTVLAADSESVSFVIRNDVNSAATVEVFSPNGDIHKDAQVRKTVLQTGAFARCGEDGGRIAMKTIPSSHNNNVNAKASIRSRTPIAVDSISQGQLQVLHAQQMRLRRESPRIIPSVEATVTPLLQDRHTSSPAYAVRVLFNVPPAIDSEWLEFGLAQPVSSSNHLSEGQVPKVQFTMATVDGMPVKIETTASSTASVVNDLDRKKLSFGDSREINWIDWVKIYVGTSLGGIVIVDYLVHDPRSAPSSRLWKGMAGLRAQTTVAILLPTFAIPVGRLRVAIDNTEGLSIVATGTNLLYRQNSTLLHFSLRDFFTPHLTITWCSIGKLNEAFYGIRHYFLFTWLVFVVGFITLHRLRSEPSSMANSIQKCTDADGMDRYDVPFLITTTLYLPESMDYRQGSLTQVISAATITATSLENDVTTGPSETPDIPHASSQPSREIIKAPTSSSSPRTPSENYGLLPVQEPLQIVWPIPDMRATFQKAVKTIDAVWQILRKVYHYPLVPP